MRINLTKQILRSCLSIVLVICGCDIVRPDAIMHFRGQILMPDGKPATKAELTFAEIRRPLFRIPTNEAACFEFSAPCLGRAKLIAKLADDSLQYCVHISPVEARSRQSDPIQITLAPAQRVEVKVTADDQPAVGVEISTDENLLASALTNTQGTAELLVPQGAGDFMLAAWHPKLGISGLSQTVEGVSSRPMSVKLALSPITPQQVQVLDEKRHPVPNLRCTANGPLSFLGWFRGSSFQNLTRTTDSAGIVTFDSVYEAAKVVDIELQDHQWMLEKSRAQIETAGTHPTIHVRKRHPATGKVVGPAGTQLAGIFVVARSSGFLDNDDTATARTDSNGNFTLSLAPAHCYVITVEEPKWTTDPLIGVFSADGAPLLPEILKLSIKPAIPLTIIAMAGQRNEPVADATIMVGRAVEWRWFDRQGQEHDAGMFLNRTLKTDRHGRVSVDLAHGKNTIHIVKGEWSESKDLDTTTDAVGNLEFHAPEVTPSRD